LSSERAPRLRRAVSALRDESGAALIEAALVLPVLLLVLFAVAEISLYLWNAELAAKAVQLGLRRAVVSDAVARGPGLDPGDSEGYWDGLAPGLRCAPAERSPCPSFTVTCGLTGPCACRGDACRFTFSPARGAPILAAMRAVLPSIGPGNVEITYATNGLGYVGRPPPIPVDVTLRLVGYEYTPLFLGSLFGARMPLRAAATLPGEGLLTR
jgi:hypothetical protein